MRHLYFVFENTERRRERFNYSPTFQALGSKVNFPVCFSNICFWPWVPLPPITHEFQHLLTKCGRIDPATESQIESAILKQSLSDQFVSASRARPRI